MKPLRFGSFFSGVGMFDLAFERAGWACAFSCEIDAHARKVYAMRFGRPVTYEDVNAIDPGTVPAADAWVGGYPCQDNSVAGKRLGEAGERSNLVYRVFDLWAALPPRRRPRWLVLENVPGALTVGDGRAFGNVIAAMVDLGFGVSWRVLDGQHFGVAQRRRRVFIVADSRGTLDGPEEVLALAQGLRGGAAPGGAPRAGAAAGAQEGARERGVVNSIDTFGGGPDDNAAQTGHLVTQAVTSKWSKGTGGPSGDECQNLVLANAVAASAGHHGHSSPRGDGSDNLVPVIDLRLAARTSDNEKKRASGGMTGLGVEESATAPTLGASSRTPGVLSPVAFHMTQDPIHGDVVPSLGREATGAVAIQFDMAQVTSPENRSRCAPGDAAPTVAASGQAHVAFLQLAQTGGNQHAVKEDGRADALSTDGRGAVFSLDTYNQKTSESAPTLRNPHGTFGDALPAVFSIRADATREGAALTPSADADGRVRLRDPGMGVTEELAPTVDASTAHAVGPFPTLRGFGHGWQGQHNDDAARAGAVRRLTPSECEMLQGLRPGWTCTCGLVPAGPHEVEYDYRRPLAPAYTTAACKCKDGPRYKLIGNGGVVPCMEWIARRLGAAHGRKP